MTDEKVYYITKYWETREIIKTVGYFMQDTPPYINVTWYDEDCSRAYTNSFWGKEWWETEEEAMAHVQKLHQKKIAALDKRLKELKQKSYKIVDFMHKYE
jgi:hypothetical protein